MGENSEVTWMQRLNAESTKRSDASHINAIAQHQLPIDNSIASMNYRLDYQKTYAGDMPNAFALPPKSLADRLFQAYLQKVHTALPVIRRDLFVVQYNSCFSKGRVKPGRQWLAVWTWFSASVVRYADFRSKKHNPNLMSMILSHVLNSSIYERLSMMEMMIYSKSRPKSWWHSTSWLHHKLTGIVGPINLAISNGSPRYVNMTSNIPLGHGTWLALLHGRVLPWG